ncbi:NAD(P)H-hydrate dehydratase [Hydrogenophaga sp. BPS33]|uniref:NAD(P)H-hydrate dehydratase n=1 Tax=Hydrogenophaga sp. BPS33 TaxID=2651974 RepID=UPI00131F7338|nr:NAD(P)H-hydrate dehydratase [Hydrogenophaga sp. BPS33]QHE88857.1 NAD(P)H-hydrate dehydratase [Hydrogenophaga sp. BPS33]
MSELTPPAGPRRITGDRREALHDTATTRQIEQQAAATLPDHTLMARAGEAVARLARALQPHASCIWIACGPGNNGGDGFVAATHLHRWAQAAGGGRRVVVTHAVHDEARQPADARWALQSAREAGVCFSDAPPAAFDLAIDALLGIGPARTFEGPLAQWLGVLRSTRAPVLNVDLPTGLNADTGALAPCDGVDSAPPGPRHTLSLLSLKPGLFTGAGRDAAGEVWLDGLGLPSTAFAAANAWLCGADADPPQRRAHASHKGSFGDVVVIGGQGIGVDGAGMTGAAILAARAALQAGAGRVFVGLLEDDGPGKPTWDPASPELMFRSTERLLDPTVLRGASVVCGCGGGLAVVPLLPAVLAHANPLVLDADALNAIANDPALRHALAQRRAQERSTVLTPHPLEAARLLQSTTAEVMADRLRAAQAIADQFGSICVLKGSGTVIAAPGETPLINPSGNALLATAGTGDVLAGMIGSAVAGPSRPPAQAFKRVAHAVFQHGALADRWTQETTLHLSAGRLAARVKPLD